MQEKYININTLKVSEKLSQFIRDELLKETDLTVDNFWSGFEKTVNELAPKNKLLKFSRFRNCVVCEYGGMLR